MNIVILSRYSDLYSNHRLIAAAEARGVQAFVVDPMQCTLIFDGTHFVIQWPAHANRHYDAVIPRYGPMWQDFSHAVQLHLEHTGALSLNSAEAIARARAKWACLQEFAQANLPFPKSIFIDHQDLMQNVLAKHLSLPCLIKQNTSSQGRGIELFQSVDAVGVRMQQLLDAGQRFIVQEFIAEASGSDLRVLVVAGQIVASMQRQACAGDFRANIYQGGHAKSVQLSVQEAELALKATELLGLDVAGVDIIRSTTGPLLLEVNACPGFEALEQVSGVDVAGKMLDLLFFKQNTKKI